MWSSFGRKDKSTVFNQFSTAPKFMLCHQKCWHSGCTFADPNRTMEWTPWKSLTMTRPLSWGKAAGPRRKSPRFQVLDWEKTHGTDGHLSHWFTSKLKWPSVPCNAVFTEWLDEFVDQTSQRVKMSQRHVNKHSLGTAFQCMFQPPRSTQVPRSSCSNATWFWKSAARRQHVDVPRSIARAWWINERGLWTSPRRAHTTLESTCIHPACTKYHEVLCSLYSI